jgi:hypothetical protein
MGILREHRDKMKTLARCIFLAVLFTFASLSVAQVYTWKGPQTGAKRFSNTVPSWFRNSHSDSQTPRVQVFYYSALVDDTGLPYESRLALRSQSPIGRYLPRWFLRTLPGRISPISSRTTDG